MKVLQISKSCNGENIVCLVIGSLVIAAGIAAVVLATTNTSGVDHPTAARET